MNKLKSSPDVTQWCDWHDSHTTGYTGSSCGYVDIMPIPLKMTDDSDERDRLHIDNPLECYVYFENLADFQSTSKTSLLLS